MWKRTTKVLWVVLVTALTMVGSASVARADQSIVAKIPFAFIVGDSRLPAGDYIVKEMLDAPSAWSIASADGRRVVYTLTIPSSPGQDPARPELVFAKFNNQYFLTRVVPEGGNERQVILTPAMREREPLNEP